MMNDLIAAVTALVGEEIQRAKENHGEKYASLHEGVGVLVEEVWEAGKELQMIRDFEMSRLINAIRLTDSQRTKGSLELVERIAINAACECIQVAAVARKMREGL